MAVLSMEDEKTILSASGHCRDEKAGEERITHRGATTYFGIAEMGRHSNFASEEEKNR